MAYGQHFAQIAGRNGAKADGGRNGTGVGKARLARKDAGAVNVKAVGHIGHRLACVDARLLQQCAGKGEVFFELPQ